METKYIIAAAVLAFLVIILIYLKWPTSEKEEPMEDDEPLPDDSDLELVEDDDNEEFAIIENDE